MTSTVVIDIPVQGPRGPKGDQGEVGPIGLRGIAGPIGQLGLQGEPGTPGAGYAATSSTSETISNSATVTLTTQTNLAYTQGARVRVSSTGSGALMEGTVSSYASLTGILIIVMDLSVGAGTHTDWTINVAGNPGTIEGVTLGTISTQNKNAVDITGGTITGMPTPTSPSDVATKTYVDNSTGAAVPTTRLVSAGGLLTGGGSLAADRTITATGATQVEAESGTDNTHVMTPLRTNQAISQLQLFKAAASQAEAQAGTENSKGMTALRVAQAIAALSTIDSLPWTAYTPTISAGGGAFGSVSAVGRYKQIGKTVHVSVNITINNAGTANAYMLFTLPVTANTTVLGGYCGREYLTNGSSLMGTLSNSTQVLVQFYNATFAAASGMGLSISGTYEAA